MKHDYLKSWTPWAWLWRAFPLPFVRCVYWRRISQDDFLSAVRPFHFHSADEDILEMFHYSPSLQIFDGKNAYRVQLKGAKYEPESERAEL